MHPIPTAARLPAALLCLLLSGCATTASAPSEADPWERVNRSTYAFNDSIDRAVLKPVAKGYRRYVPQWMRTGVTNFLTNLAYTTTLANNVLQLKLKDAASDTGVPREGRRPVSFTFVAAWVRRIPQWSSTS